MPIESVLMSLILKSSDHATQTRSTQGSTSMNSASTSFGAHGDLLIARPIVFIVFAWAFALGEYAASQEHGWGIYMASVRKYYPDFTFLIDNGPLQVWNGFDSAFIVIFFIYFCLRIKGLTSGEGT